jgi:hypothetical protein
LCKLVLTVVRGVSQETQTLVLATAITTMQQVLNVLLEVQVAAAVEVVVAVAVEEVEVVVEAEVVVVQVDHQQQIWYHLQMGQLILPTLLHSIGIKAEAGGMAVRVVEGTIDFITK